MQVGYTAVCGSTGSSSLAVERSFTIFRTHAAQSAAGCAWWLSQLCVKRNHTSPFQCIVLATVYISFYLTTQPEMDEDPLLPENTSLVQRREIFLRRAEGFAKSLNKPDLGQTLWYDCARTLEPILDWPAQQDMDTLTSSVDEVFSSLIDADSLGNNAGVLGYFLWTGLCLVLRHSSFSIGIALLRKTREYAPLSNVLMNYLLACTVKQCMKEHTPSAGDGSNDVRTSSHSFGLCLTSCRSKACSQIYPIPPYVARTCTPSMSLNFVKREPPEPPIESYDGSGRFSELPPEILQMIGNYLELGEVCHTRLLNNHIGASLQTHLFRDLQVHVTVPELLEFTAKIKRYKFASKIRRLVLIEDPIEKGLQGVQARVFPDFDCEDVFGFLDLFAIWDLQRITYFTGIEAGLTNLFTTLRNLSNIRIEVRYDRTRFRRFERFIARERCSQHGVKLWHVIIRSLRQSGHQSVKQISAKRVSFDLLSNGPDHSMPWGLKSNVSHSRRSRVNS